MSRDNVVRATITLTVERSISNNTTLGALNDLRDWIEQEYGGACLADVRDVVVGYTEFNEREGGLQHRQDAFPSVLEGIQMEVARVRAERANGGHALGRDELPHITVESPPCQAFADPAARQLDTEIVDYLALRFLPYKNSGESERQEVHVSRYTRGTLRTLREHMADVLDQWKGDPLREWKERVLRERLARERLKRGGTGGADAR